MNKSPNRPEFVLLNVPLLRPAWPVPTFTRTLPLLRSEGMKGDWWDENVKFFRYYYSEDRLRNAHEIVAQRIMDAEAHDAAKLREVLLKPIGAVVQSLCEMSEPETFKNPSRYREVFFNVFRHGARFLSYAHDVIFDYNQLIYRSPLDNRGYNFHRCQDVISLVRGDPKNIALPFYLESTMVRLTQNMPRIVGISISSAFELVPAFTLARLVKEAAGNDVHVVMGGNFLSRIEHRFRASERDANSYRPFWDWMDSYIYSKGDAALVQLVKTVLQGGDLGNVPNLVYKAPGSIEETSFAYGPGIEDLPATDYGTVLDDKRQYFVPPELLTVPIYASVGCSYAKCTFCAIDKMSGNFHAGLKVRKRNGSKFLVGDRGQKLRFFRSPRKVVEEMRALKEAHHVELFSFNDETADIDFLLEFSDSVIESGENLYWQAFVRVENALADAAVCERLYRGGCRLLRVGFEYLSQEKLNLTRKGYSLAIQNAIVKNLNSAGIWVHAYFMLGGEDDHQQLVTFFDKNPEYSTMLHSLEFFSFVKDRHSLDVLQNLKSGVYDPEEIDSQFPEFRIWFDENINARALVLEIEEFSRNNFAVYGMIHEPCEVAYFAALSHVVGVGKMIAAGRGTPY